jgi:hypothetical protein
MERPRETAAFLVLAPTEPLAFCYPRLAGTGAFTASSTWNRVSS